MCCDIATILSLSPTQYPQDRPRHSSSSGVQLSHARQHVRAYYATTITDSATANVANATDRKSIADSRVSVSTGNASTLSRTTCTQLSSTPVSPTVAGGGNKSFRAVSPRKVDLSYVSVRKRRNRQRYARTQAGHHDTTQAQAARKECLPQRQTVGPHSLNRVHLEAGNVTSLRNASASEPGDHGLSNLTGNEIDHRQEDLHDSTANSTDPISRMAERIKAHETASMSLHHIRHILREPYISARNLRVLVNLTLELLEEHYRGSQAKPLPENAVFILFMRLLRHAREVWPRAIEDLPDILLQYLPQARARPSALSVEQSNILVYALNKAMLLVALPTAIEPFDSNAYQEAAIIRILQFMSEQKPTLQINREGYRAVITVQLAQPKSTKDRQWAELKALSWPPWKQERTAMDADITPENHGTSKARQTLIRMQEAGYAHLDWEAVASIYSGWDTDATPTIQTRIHLSTGGKRFASSSAAWVARITTTRTIQEAWACYLAYQDGKLPASQDVYLAILKKLHKEEKRPKSLTRPKNMDQHHLGPRFPGDDQEIDPPPASTHLHTYTRTSPPTVSAFYEQLRAQNFEPANRCLAFFVAHASTFKLGMRYLLAGAETDPSIVSLLNPKETSHSLMQVPMPVLNAFVRLLCRYPKVPVHTVLSKKYRKEYAVARSAGSRQSLFSLRGLAHAIDLLKRHPKPIHRPLWNSVLHSLGHDTTGRYDTTSRDANAVNAESRSKDQRSEDKEKEHNLDKLNALSTSHEVLDMMHNINLDLDAQGVLSLCHITRNAAIACWKILQHAPSQPDTREADPTPQRATALLQNDNLTHRLKHETYHLLGSSPPSSASEPNPTDLLLEVPAPALLHAYIRALGWSADYAALLSLVRWMSANSAELAKRREPDRNGEVLMRRAVVALRVFLERSWLPEVDGGEERGEVEKLKRPAPEAVVDEVRELVKGVENWGSWAEEEEVREYCRGGNFEL